LRRVDEAKVAECAEFINGRASVRPLAMLPGGQSKTSEFQSPSFKNRLTRLNLVPILFSFAQLCPRPICSEARLVYAFDTLGYSKRLRDAGVPQLQAEAHAEAAGEFVMAELVTKTDIQTLTTHFDAKLDNLSLRLTIRLGVMLVAGISILAAVIKLP
jgi:hypothetical protein